MPETVIHIFKTVQIDKQGAYFMTFNLANPRERRREPCHKERTIGQACQGVMRCIVMKLFFGQLFVRDVLYLEYEIWQLGCRVACRRTAPGGPHRASGLVNV